VGTDAESAVDEILKELNKDPPKRAFEIHVGQPAENSAAADVTWCITPEAWDVLQAEGVRYPHMLVCITRVVKDSGGDEKLEEYDRMLAPLDQGFVRYQFNDPGHFRVHGVVVWSHFDEHNKGHKDRKAAFRKLGQLVAKTGATFDYRFVTWGGEFTTSGTSRCFSWVDSQDWLVPDGFFAKEPSPFWKAWSEIFWSSKPRDQCEFRDRCLKTAPLLPLGAIYMALRWELQITLMLLGVILGVRGMRPKALLHPKGWPLLSVLGEPGRDAAGYYWRTDKSGKPRRWWQMIPRMPFLWMAVGALAWAILSTSGKSVGVDLLLWCLVGAVGAVLGIVVIVGVLAWADKLFPKLGRGILQAVRAADEWLASRDAAAEVRERARLEKYYTQRLEPLICTMGGPRVGSTKALPKSHRTLKVAFYEAKAKVCKPFRRGG
jgi:hypothetical protein